MVFLDYAGRLSLQRDPLKAKILLDPRLIYPTLKTDGETSIVGLPEPRVSNESVEFLGYVFPPAEIERVRIGRLFRAMVTHLTAHTLIRSPRLLHSDSHLARFTESLLKDLLVNEHVRALSPDRLPDQAYANAFTIASARGLDEIFLPSTRVAAGILFRVFGHHHAKITNKEEALVVAEVSEKLCSAKADLAHSLNQKDLKDDSLHEMADWILGKLKDFGPFVEAPCFPYVDNATPSSFKCKDSIPGDEAVETFFPDALKALGEAAHPRSMQAFWSKQVESECLQAFSSNLVKREKEAKILRRLSEHLQDSHFKSVEVPPEDYTEYLKSREMIGGSTRRLLNNIIVTTNFEIEDIRKTYGVLDLADAIQVIASKSERSDIFLRDEIMKQSYSVVILLDVSRSMGTSPVENRARAVCIVEAVKDIVPDPTAWAFYAFSDRLYVIKDGSEAYSRTVRARLGGVPFEGATYMPDSIVGAASFLKGKSEEQRIMFILSDGYPYGYPQIYEKLREAVIVFEGLGVIIIGIGFDTERMRKLFRYNAAVYSQKDLVRKVGDIFITASAEELL